MDAKDMAYQLGLLEQIIHGAGLARPIVPQVITGMSAPAVPGVMWHGSASGDLRGGRSGLHLGTLEAARQALNARIGVPATGDWNATRSYGETPIAGRETLMRIDPRGYNRTGMNASPPSTDYLPAPSSQTPSLQPFTISGPMTNTRQTPHTDIKANALMAGAIKKGQARRGYYYKNEAEDVGSISAAVPSGTHVTPYEYLVNLFGGG